MNDQQPSLVDIVRRGVWPVVGGVLALYLFSLTIETMGRTQQQGIEGPQPNRTISVEAQGKTNARPDTARITFSVVTEGKTVAGVILENSEKMNAVVALLKSSGVADKDIATTNYNLYPKYSQVIARPGEPVNPFEQVRTSEIAGYTLTVEVAVKVRDIAKLGDFIEGAAQRGANQTGGISFFVDDPEPFQQTARAEAFQKVRQKAAVMASQAGVRLGRILNISEYGYVPPIVSPAYLERGIGGGGRAPTIEPGSQEIAVSITVTYEIR
ncbi:SIMPL domain-containing protein [Candidatus Parcubacteria bacterium]|nr:SIMPL domain-containing protein [Candidatus Parcubacteria bacterium]